MNTSVSNTEKKKIFALASSGVDYEAVFVLRGKDKTHKHDKLKQIDLQLADSTTASARTGRSNTEAHKKGGKVCIKYLTKFMYSVCPFNKKVTCRNCP